MANNKDIKFKATNNLKLFVQKKEEQEKLKKQQEANLRRKERENLLEDFNEIAETAKIVSAMHKEYFDALVNQGFSEEQALYLVGKHGLTFGGSINH